MLSRPSFNPFGIGDSEMNSRSSTSKSLVPVGNNRSSYPNAGEIKQTNDGGHYINGSSGALTHYRGTNEAMGYNGENRPMSYGGGSSRPISYQEECRPLSFHGGTCPVNYQGGSSQMVFESGNAPLPFGSSNGRQVSFESPGCNFPFPGTNNLMPYEGPTPISFQGGNSLMPYEASTAINSFQGGSSPIPMGARNIPVVYENSGPSQFANFAGAIAPLAFQGRGGPMSFGGSSSGEPLNYSGSTGSQTITTDSRMINGQTNPTSYCVTSAPLNIGGGSNRFSTNGASSGPLHFNGSGGPVSFGGLGVPLSFENSRNMPVVYDEGNYRGPSSYSSYASGVPDPRSMHHSSSSDGSHRPSGYPMHNSGVVKSARSSNSATYLNSASHEYGVKRNGLSMPYMNIDYNNSKRVMDSERATSISPYNMPQNFVYGNSGYSTSYMR